MSRELAEREAHLEEQLQGARAEASAVAEAQMAAATQAQERLEGHLAVLRATAADWQVQPASQQYPLSRLASQSALRAFSCERRHKCCNLVPTSSSASCLSPGVAGPVLKARLVTADAPPAAQTQSAFLSKPGLRRHGRRRQRRRLRKSRRRPGG